MPTHILRLPAMEAVRLLRAEMKAAYCQPELNTTIEKEYILAEDFDRRAYGLYDGEQYDLATTVAILTIEPRVERDYWQLEITVELPLGPLLPHEASILERKELTLDEFEAELRSADPKRTKVSLTYPTAAAKRRFDQWLAEMRSRHPSHEPTS